MSNPNIGLKIIEIILDFHKLDYALKCDMPDLALRAVSKMATSLRGLRRSIRAYKNLTAYINVKKEVLDNETKPH